jgi:predicted dehydrogenase
MGDEFGVGVIGAGVFGTEHARVWSELDSVRLVGVADMDPARAAAAATRFGCQAFRDARDLAASAGIQAVSVCTPDDTHVAPVLAALEAGKHVLVEKPFATTVEDCDTMMKAAARAHRFLTVGHILRFDPRYAVARAAVVGGDLGAVVHMSAKRQNNMGSADRMKARSTILFFLGIHDLDFLNWCAGVRLERVYAESVRHVLGDADDAFVATLRYANGVIASLEASWVLPRNYGTLEAGAEVVCAKGAVLVDGGFNEVRLATSGPVSHLDTVYGPEVAGQSRGALRAELEHFAACVRGGGTPLVTPAEARHAVEGICALTASLKTGAPVSLAA